MYIWLAWTINHINWFQKFVMDNEIEWLLCNAKWTICQLYHGENKLHFDEIMMMSALH